ncbi:MAG: SGNH/GDSL hydrolase family protein [Candidatus Borkfalkia sp.]
MKKIFAGVLGLFLLVFPFVGCGQKEEKEQVDLSKFPNYVEPDKAAYAFGFNEMTAPYFKGNVIYNETVMLVEDKGVVSGKLQYDPVRILSVRDYTWEKEYPASEYEISGNTLTMKAGGSMPYLTAENLLGKNIPEPYREVSSITNVETDWVLMGGSIYTESSLIYGHQVSVSYVYDVNDVKTEEFADYETSGFPELKEKLISGKDVKIVAIGDSVAEGCSSSGHFGQRPHGKLVDQSAKALDEKYTGKVSVKTWRWAEKLRMGSAAAQINAVVSETPDLVMIHFGINDAGGDMTPGTYRDNIEKIVADVQARVPDCEFMLIKAFAPTRQLQLQYVQGVLEKTRRDRRKLSGSVHAGYVYAQSYAPPKQEIHGRDRQRDQPCE